MAMTLRSVSFEVFGVPQTKGSARAFTPKGWQRPIITTTNRNCKAWEQLVAAQAQTVAGAGLFDGPVTVAVLFVLPRPKNFRKQLRAGGHHTTRPDIDKLSRSVGDALRSVLYRDDGQVVALYAFKRYAADGAPAGAQITVSEAAPPEATTPNLFTLTEETSYGTTRP